MSAFFTGSDAGKAGLEVKDGSGSPDVKGVTKINVSSGTLIDNGGGEVTITTGGGGGGGGIGGSISEDQIAVGAATADEIEGSSALTYTTGSLPIGSLMDSLTTNSVGANTGVYSSFTTSGSGTGAVISIQISGGVVDSATVTTQGKGYAIGDTITFSTSLIGGSQNAVFTLSSVSPATGVEEVFKIAASEAVLKVQDTTSNATITLDPSVPNNTGGVAMYWGINTDPELYMKLGAFAGANNIDTKSRDFRYFGATGNLMTMDESTLRVGIGGIFGLANSSDPLPLPTRTLDVGDEDASTNTSLSLLGLTRTTSGTPAAGIGVGIDFVVECEASNETGAKIEAITTDVSDGGERFDLSFKVMDGSGGAAAEKVRITSEGTLSIPTVGAGIAFPDGSTQTTAGMPKLADISNITSDTTVTSSDSGTVFLATVATAADVTVTVPGTVGTFAVGTQVVIIKNTSAGSGALKIATDGSGLLNGASAATTITIGSPYQAYTVVLVRTSNGYNEWIAIG